MTFVINKPHMTKLQMRRVLGYTFSGLSEQFKGLIHPHVVPNPYDLFNEI